MSPQKAKMTVAGYILTVSPMKYSKKNNRQYFNADLETDSAVKTAVCFSPSKRRLFEESSVNHTGCEIRNASVNESTVFVSDYSTVHLKELGFSRTNQYEFLTIANIINEVSLNTKVNAAGAVELEPVRYVTVGTSAVARSKLLGGGAKCDAGKQIGVFAGGL